jgi:hypothetical protein
MLKYIKRFSMNPKSVVSILVLLLVLLSFNYCNEDNPPVKNEFPGIVFTSETGEPLGTFGGKDDNDWKHDLAWAPEIYDLMNFDDSLDLSGTYLDSSYIAGNDPPEIPFIFFPNPVATFASVYIILPGQIKVKLVMVDANLKPVLTYSYKKSDTAWVMLDLENQSRFIEGKVYRLYYTMSVEGNMDFYRGHGDILMCGDRPPQYESTCLRYIE